jgi:hypothetical protein
MIKGEGGLAPAPTKPEGPRSDSRCHRVGLGCGSPFRASAVGAGLATWGLATWVLRPAPFWYRTDSSATCSRAWARLGPLSRGGACDRGSSTDGFVATVSAATAHPTGWLGGIPTGRPWDFALGTSEPPKGLGEFPRRAFAPRSRTGALTLHSRTRFLGSGRRSPAVTSRLRRPGSVAPGVGRISLRGPRRHVRRQ